MLLAEARQWFAQHGLPIEWRQDIGLNGQLEDAILRPPPGVSIPLDPLGLAIVMPDMHLGVGNDPFRFNDVNRARRLERFLRGLVALRDELAQGFHGFSCVQLGDFYDLMRAPGLNAHGKRASIDAQYSAAIDLCRSLPMLHCIGNHDKDFWLQPPPVAEANYALARTLGGPQLLCFHGHDRVTLFNIVVHNWAETLALTALNAINTLPLLGEFTAFLQAQGDKSLEDDSINDQVSLPWPIGVQGPIGWSAPWVAHGGAADLGNVIRGFEKGLGQQVQVAFIGHSHRPGISWTQVATRRVALIDVGSWTYGRTEFAIVASDAIGLARLA